MHTQTNTHRNLNENKTNLWQYSVKEVITEERMLSVTELCKATLMRQHKLVRQLGNRQEGAGMSELF